MKAGLGGFMIAFILALARGRHFILSGLVVSMPAVSLYTWWWIGRGHGAESLQKAVHAAMWGAIPWVMYLGVVYLLAGRLPLWATLAAGVATWFLISGVFAIVLRAAS
jgi:membrane protein GlpM